MRIGTTLIATAFLSIAPIYIAFAAEPNDAQITEFKTYLAKVVEAEAITDPVQRCLAYPDIPNLVWPKAHIEAHCRFHHEPLITLEQMQAMADAGEFTKIETAFADLQVRHRAESNQSELIHRAFEVIELGDSEKLTAAWLKNSPNNAYALTARADYLRGQAWKARGGKYAAETPRDSLTKMSEFAQQAISLYQQAIKLDPQLMHAYAGLLNVAMADSETKIQVDALTKALEVDSQCAELFRRTLIALKPRWGGSHELMLAFQERYVLPSIVSRPLNAQYMGYGYEDMVDILRKDGKTSDELMPLVLKGLALGANEDLMDQADFLLKKSGRYDLQHMYISQVIRFRGGVNHDYSNMGNYFIYFGHYEIGIRFLKKSLELDSSTVFSHYILARHYRYAGNWDDAVKHAESIKDNEIYGKEAKLIQAQALFSKKKADQALIKAIELTKRYSDYTEAWQVRLMCEIALEKYSHAKESLRVFRTLIQPNNSQHQQFIKDIELFLNAAE